MQRRMDRQEPTLVGTMDLRRNGHAVESLVASEQFYTRSCARCTGLLVNDWCYDLANTGEHNAEVFRCVQCGHRIDPVILRNQVQPPAKIPRAGHRQHRCSTDRVMSGDAA